MRKGLPKPPATEGKPSPWQTEALRLRLTADQRRPTVPKHVPSNTHVPGSIACAVAGGRVIR
jgi:hypothetical protein